MSKQVNMANWKSSTSAVYADLLANPSKFQKVHDAAVEKIPGKRLSIWNRVKLVEDATKAVIVPDLKTNPLAARLVASALTEVEWSSLTRRLINQGQVDLQMFQGIASFYLQQNGDNNGKAGR